MIMCLACQEAAYVPSAKRYHHLSARRLKLNSQLQIALMLVRGLQ